jgi:hypothetical protein
MRLHRDGLIQISAKDLGSIAFDNFCSRCFWLNLRVDKRLAFSGIYSSIDVGTKHWVAAHVREHGTLPACLASICPGFKRLVPSRRLYWKYYSCLDVETNIRLTGAPDDVFVDECGGHHLIDYKTARLTENQDGLLPRYDIQLTGYAYIGEQLEKEPLAPMRTATLAFMEPMTDAFSMAKADNWMDGGFRIEFKAALKPMELDFSKIPPLLRAARNIADLKKPPRGLDGCPECAWRANLFALAPPEPDLVEALTESLAYVKARGR